MNYCCHEASHVCDAIEARNILTWNTAASLLPT